MAKYLRQIDGIEPRQNDIYASIVQISLSYGPQLLNHIHRDHPIEFRTESKLTEIQHVIDSEDDRELDWVIQRPIVGFESKKGDPLTEKQLIAEIEDLRKHSDSPTLIAVTDHLREPTEILERARDGLKESEMILWISWHKIARIVHQLQDQELPPAQRPLRDILQDMFNEEGYHPPFDGIVSHDRSDEQVIQRESQLVALITDLTQKLPNQFDVNQPQLVAYDALAYSGTSLDTIRKPHRSLSPRWVSIRFLLSDTGSKPRGKSSISLLASLNRDDFRPVLDINADLDTNTKDIEHKAVTENVEELIGLIDDLSLNVWTSKNCYGHTSHGLTEHSNLEEIRSIFDDEETFGISSHKRLVVGYQLKEGDHGPQEFIKEIVESLEKIHREFIEETDIFDDVFPETYAQAQ